MEIQKTGTSSQKYTRNAPNKKYPMLPRQNTRANKNSGSAASKVSVLYVSTQLSANFGKYVITTIFT